MRTAPLLATATALLGVRLADAYSHFAGPKRFHPMMPSQMMVDADPVPPPPDMKNTTFTQLIDHGNPSLGTFEQFYYYNSKYWAGPGSPIVFFTPGESNVTRFSSYATTNRTTGVMAERLGAAVIVMEHRYYGNSSPYSILSTANLTHLTLDNVIADFVRFAQTSKLPFAPQGGTNATAAPWIFVGGSYPGCLAVWTEHLAGGTFWAYWASSAPVEVMDYWQWFEPVRRGMPRNCSADVERVVEHVDHVGMNGTIEEQKSLKTMFGLEEVEHYDDFATTLQNGVYLWQGNQFSRNTGFFNFCDVVEGVRGVGAQNWTVFNTSLPLAEGVGLQKALVNYAAWVNETFLPGYCEDLGYPDYKGKKNVRCLETYNASSPLNTDQTLFSGTNRQLAWLLCNEPLGWWETGAPPGRPTIASRYGDRYYFERQCPMLFPPSPSGDIVGIANGRTLEAVNKRTGGWFVGNTTRVLFVNGEFDPWREAGVSSTFRPGGPLESTAQVPVKVIPDAVHAIDLVTADADANEGCRKVRDEGIEIITDWIAEWKLIHGKGIGNGSSSGNGSYSHGMN